MKMRTLTIIALLEHVQTDVDATLCGLSVAAGKLRRRCERRAERRVAERDIDVR